MFYGVYSHSIDKKGRLIIPARFREAIRDSSTIGEAPECFFVTRGLEHCLFVFTPREWNNIILKLKQQPLLKGKAREFMRLFFSGACKAECDKQGRISLPKHLLAWAGIEKDVVAIGVLNRFEIWDERRWREYRADREKEYEEIAESLIDTV